VGRAYGSFAKPVEKGAGPGPDIPYDTRGGAAVRLMAGSLIIKGEIDVYGNTAGAGGSILIETDDLTLNGTIWANGGNGYSSGDDSASGGGGRIAVYYSRLLEGDLEANLYAPGGWTPSPEADDIGGAGTIFLFDTFDIGDGIASTYGRLIVDNTGASTAPTPLAGQPTPVIAIGSGAVASFSSTDDPTVWTLQKPGADGFPYNPEGGYIEFSGTWIAGPYLIMGLDPADSRILHFKIDDALIPPEDASGVGYSGSYRLDSIAVRGGATLIFSDPINCQSINISFDDPIVSTLVAPNYTMSGGCQ